MKRYSLWIVFLTFVLFVALDGHSQTPSVSKDVVIVLDSSGIMKVDDPELPLSKVVSEILGSLPEGSRVSFTVYTGKVETVMQLTPVSDAGIGEKTREALSRLGSVKTEGKEVTVTIRKGDTLWELADKYYGDANKWPRILEYNRLPRNGKNLPVGTVIRIPANGEASTDGTKIQKRAGIPMAMEKAIYDLKQSSEENAEKQVILITNGFIDVKDSALAVERYRWLQEELASESKTAGIRIFSIALTDRADFQFMQTLAQKTNGGYYRVFHPEDIQIALNGIGKAAPVSAPVSELQPSPQITQAEATPVETEKGLPKGLLVGMIVAAGLIIASVTIFVFMRGRKGNKNSVSVSAISGAYLMDLGGVTEKSNYAINKSIIKIGRAKSEDVDILINRGTVSTVHAQIEYRDKNFYLTDLGSTNGTYLNDEEEKIAGEVRISAGDIISFDQYKFKLVARGQVSRGAARSSGQAGAKSKSSPNRSSSPNMSAAASNKDAKDTPANGSKDTPANRSRGASANKDIADCEAYLEDASGITNKESHRISKRITKIGRAKGNSVDIFIDGNTISGVHAQIEYRDGDFYLTDKGSTNGTYLSEERERITSEVRLKSNDVIYFDQYKFKFVMHEQDEHAEAQLSASSGAKVGG